MKAKKGFVLRNVVGENILRPVGDNINQLNGNLLMNEAAAFVWEKLQKSSSRDDLLQAVLNKFDVDEATAAADLDKLLEELQNYGLIESDD